MPYYIRVLAESAKRVPVSQLQERLRKDGLDHKITLDDGTLEAWDQILLSHQGETEIAVIERNEVVPGSLGNDDLGEFIEEMDTAQPRSAAVWLKAYLPTVKAIYAFQLLSGTDTNKGWEAVWSVQAEIWGELQGIMQAGGEGFTNREGFQITWEFSDRASGEWQMAVLVNGKWQPFKMDLGNKAQREAFLEGRVPDGVKPIS